MKHCFTILSVLTIFLASTQVKILGDLSYGGPKEGGSIFSLYIENETFDHLYNPTFISFMSAFQNSVVRANNGKFYGVGVIYQPMVYELNHKGKIFEWDPVSGEYKVLSTINVTSWPTTHSAYNRPIVYDEINNVLYTNNNKAIYKYDIDNEHGEVIFEFEDAVNISDFNIVLSHGKIWGTKKLQPNINSFVLYSLDLATLTEEIHHTAANMRSISVHDGIIYGAQNSGFYMYDIANDETQSFNFFVSGGANLNQILRVDNKVYCTTSNSGDNGFGTLRSFDLTSQQWSILLHLDNQNSGVLGGEPGLSLVNIDNYLYFATRHFGDAPFQGKGTFLKFDLSDNSVSKIFDGDTAAVYNNWGGVLYYDSVDDAIYGLSHGGGSKGSGALYSVDLQDESLTIHKNSREFEAGDGYPLGMSVYGNGKMKGLMTEFLFDTIKIYDYDMIDSTLNIVHEFDTEGWSYSPRPDISADYYTYNYEMNGQNAIHLLDFNTQQVSIHEWSHPTVSTPRFTIYDGADLVYIISEEGGVHDAGAVLKLDISNNQLTTIYDYNEDEVAWNNISGCELIGDELFVSSTYVLNRLNIFSGENDMLVVLNEDDSDQTGVGFNTFKVVGDLVYGIHNWGGSNNSGVIFSIDLNSNDYNVIYDFELSTGGRPIHYFNEKLYFYIDNGFLNFGIFVYDLTDDSNDFIPLNFSEHGYSGAGMMTIIDECELADYTIAQSGNTLTLNLPSDAQIEWVNCDDETTILSTEPSFTPTESGDYKAFVSLSSCDVETDCIPVQLSNIDENQYALQFTMYPNPATSSVTISQIEQPSTIIITDLNGRVILTTQTEEASLEVALDHCASGVYLVRVKNEDFELIQKLVVQ